jgi:hypothetical protein
MRRASWGVSAKSNPGQDCSTFSEAINVPTSQPPSSIVFSVSGRD